MGSIESLLIILPVNHQYMLFRAPFDDGDSVKVVFCTDGGAPIRVHITAPQMDAYDSRGDLSAGEHIICRRGLSASTWAAVDTCTWCP